MRTFSVTVQNYGNQKNGDFESSLQKINVWAFKSQ